MDKNKLFIVSDEHYYHSRLIEYKVRFFDDTKQMNETMILNNNNVVRKNDIVLHLGDFSFGGKDLIKNVTKQLNGQHYLILGNHDRKRTITFFYRMGFTKVYKYPIYLNNIILSHEPIEPNVIRNIKKINYHGHIHSEEHYNDFLKNHAKELSNHYKNFAVEHINYNPIEIKTKKIKKEILSYLLKE